MGPNGTGKSTLAFALMGHPNYEVTKGEVDFRGKNIVDLDTDERSRLGLFLAFQYPVAIPGVTVANFLRMAINAKRKQDDPEYKGVPIPEFRKLLKQKMDMLEMSHDFAGRYLNEGFSGGEKKRLEILQLEMLKPKVALLDETDSGLDIDALKVVSRGINRASRAGTAVLLVTHYQRILEHVTPDVVHVFMDGRIVRSGGPEQALELEEKGYEWLGDAGASATGGLG